MKAWMGAVALAGMVVSVAANADGNQLLLSAKPAFNRWRLHLTQPRL